MSHALVGQRETGDRRKIAHGVCTVGDEKKTGVYRNGIGVHKVEECVVGSWWFGKWQPNLKKAFIREKKLNWHVRGCLRQCHTSTILQIICDQVILELSSKQKVILDLSSQKKN